jgi:RNA polymerase sigma factor (sigma-70 family)
MDIQKLIEQLRVGDEAAGPILVSIIAPRLVGYAEMIASDLPLADRERIVEIAIESAVSRIDRYDPSRGTFPGWVRAFVANAAKDWRRRFPRGAPAPLDEMTYVAESGADLEDEHRELMPDALRALLLTSSEADQLMIRLFYQEGLAHASIATQLGVSEPASRKRLERAITRLRGRAIEDPDLVRYLRGGKQ